jgi:hypothetical protein
MVINGMHYNKDCYCESCKSQHKKVSDTPTQPEPQQEEWNWEDKFDEFSTGKTWEADGMVILATPAEVKEFIFDALARQKAELIESRGEEIMEALRIQRDLFNKESVISLPNLRINEMENKMKYRVWENNGNYKVQRKRLFRWEWLDVVKEWDAWYGQKHPFIFKSRESMEKFLKEQTGWRIVHITTNKENDEKI